MSQAISISRCAIAPGCRPARPWPDSQTPTLATARHSCRGAKRARPPRPPRRSIRANLRRAGWIALLGSQWPGRRGPPQ
eukprot:9354942-Pyramimonas_sp.AAC.1